MKKVFLSVVALVFVFTACNSDKDKNTYTAAEKKFNEKKYAEALIDYKYIIEEYSSSEFAAQSLMRVGSMYQMFLVPKLNADESNKKAVEYYQKLVKDFPKHADSPKALFMCGFILANNLNKIDEAKTAYQKFLNDYSTHELAPQVKAELENLGKTPEEILEQKLSKK